LIERLTVSVDGMGGDNAPEMVVAGLARASQKLEGVDFLLFGDVEVLDPLVASHGGLGSFCTIRHSPDIITNDMKPTSALRSGRESSMYKAISAVAEGEAQAMISAGNTGALMAIATIVLRTIPGISRPAIAKCFPTQRGESVMLDLGANVECDADNLVQFAVMGEAYARNIIGLKQPTVGVLNIGVEDLKGRSSVREAASILQTIDLPIKFAGFVEGDDLAKGTVDVIVTDGFTGNIALKTAEGTAKLFVHFLRQALTASPMTKLGAMLLKPALKKFSRQFDPRTYDGAMLVGLNGVCIKAHGGTDALGFSNALGVAVDLVRGNFNDRIKEDLASLVSAPVEPKAAAVR
jgi:glycerol-3-phosphate acyltransferase PlsX